MTEAGAERFVAEIDGAGGKAFAIQANVSVVAEVERLLAEAVATFGPLDILINNASVFAFASLEQTTDEQLHRMLDTNLWGTIVTCREALKHFGKDGGSIINICAGRLCFVRVFGVTVSVRCIRSALFMHKGLIVSRAPISPGGGLERFGTDVDAISASYSYFNALIGSTRDARCAGMKPAHSATSASATAESASTAGSAPVI